MAAFDLSTKTRYGTNGATFLGKVEGLSFYEHPRLGDEGCLMVAVGFVLHKTPWFGELPDSDEVRDFLKMNY